MAASMTLRPRQHRQARRRSARSCDRLGITLLPPDINRSEARFSVEIAPRGPAKPARSATRWPRSRGSARRRWRRWSPSARRSGPFRTSPISRARIDPQADQPLAAREPGQGRRLRLPRAQPRARLRRDRDRAAHAQRTAEERDSQPGEPVRRRSGRAAAARLPNVADWPTFERLANEFEAIGFYLSAHPLDAYAKGLARLGVVRVDRDRAAPASRAAARASSSPAS